ncbi:endonuclease domain-containing protein [Pseudoclavibacter alba]|uniref:Endonuclease domain-containing protein n=1 Tax=Pseudoclavibacter albus TaxID=272241 RepID=A0ABT2HVG8_9MICO|nr:endonuclease domain-containing protein [Pseudoclavibacter alba]MCT2042305.1 endonuclease domain-containing protein [Pseudoclavibacter alba]
MIETCLPTPKLQYEARDPRGSFIGRTDFAWPELGVLGEFDGRVKYDGNLGGSVTPADIIMREKEREARLRDAGFTVVRWGWDALMRPGVLERRLRQALSS